MLAIDWNLLSHDAAQAQHYCQKRQFHSSLSRKILSPTVRGFQTDDITADCAYLTVDKSILIVNLIYAQRVSKITEKSTRGFPKFLWTYSLAILNLW